MDEPTTTGTIQNEYAQLEPLREPFLQRARDASELTLPSLIPPSGANSNTVYRTPYQSVGATGVNALGNKLLIALFPPNSPFFRLVPNAAELRQAKEQNPELVVEVEQALGEIESTAMRELEASPCRAKFFEAIVNLIVAGNALLDLRDFNGVRTFPLHSYVVQRDPQGNLLKIIIKESVSPDTLSNDIRSSVAIDRSKDKTVDLFTRISWSGTSWMFEQEIKGVSVSEPGTGWPKDQLPFIPLRWNQVEGESYGRGYVEALMGDLVSAEGLSQALTEGAAQAAVVKWLVNPNGVTKAEDLARSENGAFVPGVEEDVVALQLQKTSDFSVAAQRLDKIEDRMSRAFLLHTAVRDAERVTAEEIRFIAQELETSLGGVYATLSQELQLPLVRILLSRLKAKGKVADFPKDSVQPAIVAGMEAIGRGNDLNKLDTFVAGAKEMLGPELFAQFVDVTIYLKRRATALALEINDGLVRDKEQVDQLVQAQRSQAISERAAPQVAQQIGQAMQAQAAQ